MRKGLIIVSLLGWIAGCGGSSKSGNGGGGGSGGGGGTGGGVAAGGGGTAANPDLATPAAPPDMVQLNCSQLSMCINANPNDSSVQQACYNASTTTAQNLFNAYQNCFTTECTPVSATSTDPCLQTQDACLSCTQSGVATTDMGMIQGYSATCVTTQGGATQTSPTCSTCIAAVYACQLDM